MQQIKNHLKQNPNHTISIEYNGRRKINPYAKANKYLFTKSNIQSGWGSVEVFLKGLKNEGFPSGTKVYLRIPNGNSSKIIGEPITLQFSGDINQKEKQMTVTNSHSTNALQANTTVAAYSHGMNMPNMTGVHPAVSKLEAIEAKYEHIKAVKDEQKEEIQDLRSKVRTLSEKNSSLQLQLDTAEQRQELAILKANLDSKGFMDSDAMKEFTKNLAPVLPQLIGNRTPTAVGMVGATSTVSEIKKDFIEFISSEKVADPEIDLIYSLYKRAVLKPEFATALQELLSNYEY